MSDNASYVSKATAQWVTARLTVNIKVRNVEYDGPTSDVCLETALREGVESKMFIAGSDYFEHAGTTEIEDSEVISVTGWELADEL